MITCLPVDGFFKEFTESVSIMGGAKGLAWGSY